MRIELPRARILCPAPGVDASICTVEDKWCDWGDSRGGLYARWFHHEGIVVPNEIIRILEALGEVFGDSEYPAREEPICEFDTEAEVLDFIRYRPGTRAVQCSSVTWYYPGEGMFGRWIGLEQIDWEQIKRQTALRLSSGPLVRSLS